ncbi:MAG: 3-phenylpropionate/trans-cinnamate dioxygenase ferredoxin reductase component [Solirubrobacteraceae bacterium]|jgi:NADPH-dependent 2,4-dienoyl-CoA reductase/sulfur reductase-like enzyme|nr:3-phenylpropionate/trans-cinnamate dioxygenase ferredoxin reductase component [Solirubrobacteraceae bacterium]
MSEAPQRIVVVGAGLAAQRCCAALRRLGHDGQITLFGDEGRLPYDRPPLSKEVLAGTDPEGSLELRPGRWYADHGIDVRAGVAATGLDPAAGHVLLADGAREPYDRLLIATGARPRPLPRTEGYANVHVLRSAIDAARLRARLRPGARLVIVGAGIVGLEVAATARGLGVDVTVLDAAPAPLLRIVGPQLAEWFAGLHREEGVRLLLETGVAGFRAANDEVRAVRLDNGSEVECDAVLVGIGVAPATEWLAGTALAGRGIPIDAGGRSPVQDVYAAGDCALAFNARTGRHEPSDHWEAAGRQGAAAAHAMVGLTPPPTGHASFWSDQYGVRFQLLGDPRDADEVRIDGAPEVRDFTALYVREDRVVAGLLAGRPRALPALRDAIEQHTHPERTPV